VGSRIPRSYEKKDAERPIHPHYHKFEFILDRLPPPA
jgi:hypothetical protein